MVNLGKVLLYTHIPNETYTTSWNQKRKNSMMGVKKGFPDYVILTPKEALFVEMKRSKGGVVSEEQKQWLQTLQNLGFRAQVCHGYEEAKLFIEGKS